MSEILRFASDDADVAQAGALSETVQFQLLAALWSSDPGETVIVASVPVSAVSVLPREGGDATATLVALEASFRPATATFDELVAELASVREPRSTSTLGAGGTSQDDAKEELYVLVTKGTFLFYNQQRVLGGLTLFPEKEEEGDAHHVAMETTMNGDVDPPTHKSSIVASLPQLTIVIESCAPLPQSVLYPSLGLADGSTPMADDEIVATPLDGENTEIDSIEKPSAVTHDPQTGEADEVATTHVVVMDFRPVVDEEDIHRDRIERDAAAAWNLIRHVREMVKLAQVEYNRRIDVSSSQGSEWLAIRSLEVQGSDVIYRRARAQWATAQLKFESRIAFAIASERLWALAGAESEERERLRAEWAEGAIDIALFKSSYLAAGRRMSPFPSLFGPLSFEVKRSPRTPRSTPRMM